MFNDRQRHHRQISQSYKPQTSLTCDEIQRNSLRLLYLQQTEH